MRIWLLLPGGCAVLRKRKTRKTPALASPLFIGLGHNTASYSAHKNFGMPVSVSDVKIINWHRHWYRTMKSVTSSTLKIFVYNYVITWRELPSDFVHACWPVHKEKFQKFVSFALPLCPHITTREPLNRLWWDMILVVFANICRHIPLLVKLLYSNWHFTWRPPVFLRTSQA